MNTFQETLYNNLMTLVKESENEKKQTFGFKDVNCLINKNVFYRIFNYQIPKYKDFLREGALSCRGTMFKINTDTNKISLASLPMDKFFAYGESPETEKIDFNEVKEIYLKIDGSLLSTYIDSNGGLALKSKSEPIFYFNHILQEFLNNNLGFKKDLLTLTQNNYTVDLEFTSPETRVILDYKTVSMSILNIRNNLNGETIDFRTKYFLSTYNNIEPFLVKALDVNILKNVSEKNKFLNLPNIEGAVAVLNNNKKFKIKTLWYMYQHEYIRISDFSKAGEKLFMIVMNDSVDELRSLLFFKDRSPNFNLKEKLAAIDKAETIIQEKYGTFTLIVTEFFNNNKHLDIESFISLANQTVDKEYLTPLILLKKEIQSDIRELFILTYRKKIKLT